MFSKLILFFPFTISHHWNAIVQLRMRFWLHGSGLVSFRFVPFVSFSCAFVVVFSAAVAVVAVLMHTKRDSYVFNMMRIGVHSSGAVPIRAQMHCGTLKRVTSLFQHLFESNFVSFGDDLAKNLSKVCTTDFQNDWIRKPNRRSHYYRSKSTKTHLTRKNDGGKNARTN